MRKITLILIINLITILTISANDLELRMVNFNHTGDKLFVDVEMRGSSYDFILADHNLRAYYDNTQLKLKDIISELPANYSSPKWNESHTNGYDLDVNRLPFEDHMSFINMSVLMNDKATKGVEISTEWSLIYTLEFEVINAKNDVMIAWAMEGYTDQYATAFVQVSEWVGPNQIASMRVFDLINFEKELTHNSAEDIRFDIAVAPNPATEYITITTSASEDVQYSLIDMSGKIVLAGSIEGSGRIGLAEIISGSYVLFVESGAESHAEQIIIE